MRLSSAIRNFLLQPLGALIVYLGLVITTLHLEVPVLMTIHLELLCFALVIALTVYQLATQDKAELSFAHPLVVPLMLVCLYVIAPMLASLTSGDYLAILDDGEYKSLVKILFFAPCLFYFLSKEKYRDVILNSMVFFYVILGFYFLYRYFVLNEARAYDDRPLLHIRHGDPNFLCTFFSMMVPLALWQAWKYYGKSQTKVAALHLFASLLLICCAFITESRMGIIALLLGLGFLMTRRFSGSNKEKALKVAGATFFALLVGVVALQGSLSKRFSDINDKSSTDRILTYQNGVKVFLDNPLFGAGMHKARETFFKNSQYPRFQSEFNPLEIHNTYLNVAAELGVFGFIAFAGLFLWAALQINRAAGVDKNFLIASYIIFVVSGLTVGLTYKDLFVLHIFVLAGLAQSKAEAV